ncbi:MAG: hypothetical protein N2321_06955, partial [Melioribacteraceae bacterium]|nr:hypothetical protein [Melioribacteraceae bacterium]
SLVLSLILIFLIVKNYNIINDGNSNNLHETINDSQVVSQYFYEIDDDVKAKYFDVIITQPLPIETKNNFEKEQIISFYDSIIDDTSLDYNLSEDELNKLIADLKINIK